MTEARVTVRLSRETLARLDGLAGCWGVSRAGAIRRLITEAEEAGPAPPIPTTDELMMLAAERARQGNMAAIAFLMARAPDERDQELSRILERLGAGDQ